MKINNCFYKEIIEHCKSEYPKEACGILAGKIVQSSMFNVQRLVTMVYKMANISENPEICYLMNPQEQLKVFNQMQSLGYELIGIYHSHPQTDAYPSQHDVELAYYPEATYVIVSLKDFNNPKVCAFKITEGKIEQELFIRDETA